jgi:hypothetical protein
MVFILLRTTHSPAHPSTFAKRPFPVPFVVMLQALVMSATACTTVPQRGSDAAPEAALLDTAELDDRVTPLDRPTVDDSPERDSWVTETGLVTDASNDTPSIRDAMMDNDAMALPPINMRSVPSAPGAAQVVFAGHTLRVRTASAAGPGPNDWDANNVWVDDRGYLHLKIAFRGNRWNCGEVVSMNTFGFGTYRFVVVGRPELFDPNVVAGLFMYSGPDGSNELDIEFTNWGGAQAERGNWGVYPAVLRPPPATQRFHFVGASSSSTHVYAWSSAQVVFQYYNTYAPQRDIAPTATWTYAPPDSVTRIPQSPLPLHINLWLFRGMPPTDRQEVELVIADFSFTPG